MFYYIPVIYPQVPCIYYNLSSIFQNFWLHLFTIPLYDYYKSYLTVLNHLNDYLMLHNFCKIPRPINRDYLPLNKLHYLTRFEKINPYKRSFYMWIVQYDVLSYMPSHLQSWLYYLKYNVYGQYLKVYQGYDTWSKGISNVYHNAVENIVYSVYRAYFAEPVDKKGNIEMAYMVVGSLLVLLFIMKMFQFCFQALLDYYPETEAAAGYLTEDRIENSFDFTDTHDALIDEEEDEFAENHYATTSSDLLPEYDISADAFILGTEYFDIDYIKTEIEFESKFNNLLSRENQEDLIYKIFSNEKS